MIYEKLGKVTQDPYLISLYENRCRELASMIKVCEYNCGGNAAASDIQELTLNESSMDIEVDLKMSVLSVISRSCFPVQIRLRTLPIRKRTR
jgi:hypothetical protein